jgi:CDGSH-type Zn-finger protein
VTGAPDRGGARITVYPDGPLIVRGSFILDDLDEGRLPTGRLIALCRCGRSATKPLCDGSHKISRSCRAGPADAEPNPP